MTRNRLRDISAATEGDRTMFRIPRISGRLPWPMLIARSPSGSVLTSAGYGRGRRRPRHCRSRSRTAAYAVRPEIVAGTVPGHDREPQRSERRLDARPDSGWDVDRGVQAVLVTGTGKVGCGAIEQSVIAAGVRGHGHFGRQPAQPGQSDRHARNGYVGRNLRSAGSTAPLPNSPSDRPEKWTMPRHE